MKKFKFVITLCLAVLIACIPTVIRPNVTDGIMPLNLHTLHTVTSFGFVDHHARVSVDFTGYEETASLRVDVRIERQGFMLFRETVVSGSYTFQGESYQDEFFYPIYEDGVYDCSVTYTVTDGSGTDTVTFTDTQTYRLSDHAEHTHIWNVERINPTYSKNGLERKFCYCGKFENTELEKLEYPAYSHTESEKQMISTGAANQSVSLSVPSAWGNSVSLNQTSDYFSYCNCISCSWERATAKIRAAEPKKPSSPRAVNTNPWYMSYLGTQGPTTSHRFNH